MKMISHGLFNSGSSTCLAWFAILWSCTPVASCQLEWRKAMIFWRIFVKSSICHWHLFTVQLRCYLEPMRCKQNKQNTTLIFKPCIFQLSIIENVALNYPSILWANTCWLVCLSSFNWKSCKINKSLTNSGPSDKRQCYKQASKILCLFAYKTDKKCNTMNDLLWDTPL